MVCFLFWISCENPVTEDQDIIPPEIISVSLNKENPVDQIVEIFCTVSDNKGIEQVQLWINSNHYDNMVDTQFPYIFELNTSVYDENNEPLFKEDIIYNIQVKVIDNSGNTTFSDPPHQIEVDNSNSAPVQPIITDVIYSNGKNIIYWLKNSEDDFKEYRLRKRDNSNSVPWITILQTSNQNTIFYEDYDIEPFNSVDYVLIVYDIFGYASQSSMVNSLVESAPQSVHITDISYTVEELTVFWEMSNANDFKSYKLLHSFYNEGPYDTIAEYFNKNIQSHSLNFDIDNGLTPIVENWFKVMVTDTFELSIIGNSMRNDIDPPPSPVSIDSVFYSTQNMLLYWQLSSEDDIVGYELIKNGTEQYAFVNDFFTDSIYVISPDLSEPILFDIITWDYWGQSTFNEQGYEIINHKPISPEILNIEYDPISLTITWSKNNEFDFEHYKIYHSIFPEFESADIIEEIDNNMDTTFTLSTMHYRFDEDNYFWVEVTDYWNKTAVSYGTHMFQYQSYSIPNSVNLYSPYFTQDGFFQLKWSDTEITCLECCEPLNCPAFNRYSVKKADNIEMIGAEIFMDSIGYGNWLGWTVDETGYIPIGNNETDNYYQIMITDDYDITVSSNIVRIWYDQDEDEWLPVESGNFTYGSDNQLINFPDYFEIQKYPVTNVQYINYLRKNILKEGGENYFGDIIDHSLIIELNSYGIGDKIRDNFEYLPYEWSTTHLRDLFVFSDSKINFDGKDFFVNQDHENHPITGVTWFGSYKFAKDINARLPNDLEWEKTSRGSLGYNYPWAIDQLTDVILETNANYRESGDPWDDGTTPVGYYDGINVGTIDSPSQFGAYDMAGNVREWTDTKTGNGYYFVKGGYYNNIITSWMLMSWQHEEFLPEISSNNIGFRCVRN